MSEKENKSLRLSVSKTKTFIDCNKKYYYSYVLKLPKKERDYHIFGKFVHKVLENFHREYIQASKEPFNDVMSASFDDAIKEFGPSMTKEAKQEAYEMVDKYLQKITKEKDSIKTITDVEKNFDFNISKNVILNGMIDRIQIDPDGVVHVCDYKTVKNKKYIKNDFFQLLTYAYVIHSENPEIKKVRGSYVLLRHDFEYITKEFSIDEILEIKDKYDSYAKMIEEEKLWRPTTGPLCRFCDFLDTCKDGKTFLNGNIKVGETQW